VFQKWTKKIHKKKKINRFLVLGARSTTILALPTYVADNNPFFIYFHTNLLIFFFIFSFSFSFFRRMLMLLGLRGGGRPSKRRYRIAYALLAIGAAFWIAAAAVYASLPKDNDDARLLVPFFVVFGLMVGLRGALMIYWMSRSNDGGGGHAGGGGGGRAGGGSHAGGPYPANGGYPGGGHGQAQQAPAPPGSFASPGYPAHNQQQPYHQQQQFQPYQQQQQQQQPQPYQQPYQGGGGNAGYPGARV
jgi:hypothetical protein